MNAAQTSRIEKERYPERYCLKCLWRVHPGKPCPRHGPPIVEEETYPEHEKLKAVTVNWVAVRAFLDWLFDDAKIVLGEYVEIDGDRPEVKRLVPIDDSRLVLMGRFFNIDLEAVDRERASMMERSRETSEMPTYQSNREIRRRQQQQARTQRGACLECGCQPPYHADKCPNATLCEECKWAYPYHNLKCSRLPAGAIAGNETRIAKKGARHA